MVDFNKMKEFMSAAQQRQKSFTRSEGGVDWFSMKQDGSYEVRILDIPMMTSGVHWGILKGIENKPGGTIKCPKVFNDSPCPVCEMVEALAVSSKAEEQEQAKRWKAKIKYPVILIDLREDVPAPKPRVWEATFQALEDIHSWGSNPKYGDITHPQNGRNVEIVKTTVRRGAFEYAEYKVQPDPDRSSINLQGVTMPDLQKVFKPRSYEDIEYAILNGKYPGQNEESFEEEKPKAPANRFTTPSIPSKIVPTNYSKGLPGPKVRDEVEDETEELITETLEAPVAPPSNPGLTKMLQGRLQSLKGKK